MTRAHLRQRFVLGFESLESRLAMATHTAADGTHADDLNHDEPVLVGKLAPEVVGESTALDSTVHAVAHHEDGGGSHDPHPDDPIKAAEHAALMNLVQHSAATHVATQSGAWSDTVTWGGNIPADNSRVVIPREITVTLDGLRSERLHWVRVDGTLRFATDQDTKLIVDTLVVDPAGHLEIVTDRQASILIADRGPIDTTWDPLVLSRGVMSHGRATILGSETTPYVTLDRDPQAGDHELLLSAVPVNWKAGDRLIVPGQVRGQDDDVTIKSVNGSSVTLTRPIEFNHPTLSSEEEGALVRPLVANFTRNVVIESENNSDIARRGHVMFMHSNHVEVQYTGFYGLGRTDKSRIVTDPTLDANGAAIPDTLANPRGRYAVHFHRQGGSKNDQPVIAYGNAIVDSPGWGLVNHSSHVVAENNVSYDVLGAHFVTEIGDEIGAFRHNVAIYSKGDPRGRPSGFASDRGNFDWGHLGHGFWIQGGGTVELADNFSSGQAAASYIYMGRDEVRIPIANLADPNIEASLSEKTRAKGFILSNSVPLRFYHNTSIASLAAFNLWSIRDDAGHGIWSEIFDSAFFHNDSSSSGPVSFSYSGKLHFKRTRIIGDVNNPHSIGIASGTSTLGMIYEDMHVEGFNIGIKAPMRSDNWFRAGYYNNVNSFLIHNIARTGFERQLFFDGRQRFGALADEVLAIVPQFEEKGVPRGARQYDYYMTQDYINGKFGQLYEADSVEWETWFESPSPFVSRIDVVKVGDEFLSYYEFGPSYNLGSLVALPGELRLKPDGTSRTNAELQAETGLFLGGVVVPTDAVERPRTHGWYHRPRDLATPGDDTIYLTSNSQETALNVSIGEPGTGQPVLSWPLNSTQPLIVDTLAGNDRLIVQLGAGTSGPAGGIQLRAGAGVKALMIESGDATINAIANDGALLSTTVSSGAQLTTARMNQNGLTLSGAGTKVTIQPDGALASVLESLTMDATSTLDLTNNDLILRATAGTKDAIHADAQAKITGAQNGMDGNFITSWDGTGITSASARASNVATGFDLVGLGVIRNSDLDIMTGILGSSYTSFGGVPVTADDVLLKYTYLGDGNLDGLVSFDDYVGMDNAFFGLIPNLGWATGDVNSDNVINFDDYSVVDQAFFFQGAAFASNDSIAPAGSPVSHTAEPGS